MLKTNIQLFASPENGGYANYLNTAAVDPTSMANTSNVGAGYTDGSGNPITGALSNLTAEMKEFYSQYLIKDVGPNLIHAQFLETEKLPRNHGRTIEWRKWTNFSKKTTPLTEGVTPEPSKISANPIRAELAQFGDWSLLTDLVQLQTVDNTLVEFTEKHSENAKLTLDTITREKMIAGAPEFAYAGNADSVEEMSSAITPNDVARLTAYLRQNNAPTFDGSYVMIIHPFIAYDLMTNQNWIDVVKYSDSTKIFNGEIGKLYGIRFVESTESKVNKAPIIATGTAVDGGAAVVEVSGAYDSTNHKISVAANTFTADDATALADVTLYLGHKSGDDIIVEELTVSAIDATNQKITVSDPTNTPAKGDIIFAEGSAMGKDYFTCLVLGKGAGRKVDIDGNTAEMIVKPIGSAGSTDALNQRGSVGWKVNAYTAAITNENYIYKYYCTSALDGAKAND